MSIQSPPPTVTAPEQVQDTSFALPPQAPSSTPRYGATPTASAAASASKATPTSTRALAPDLLRGLILPLMSLDHAALFMGAWLHGTPAQSESASTPFHRWNSTTAYIARTLTHLCAPGFFFLMGMGVVYFHRTRAKLRWPTSKMARHFAVRAAVLCVLSEVLGESLMWGRGVWVVNIVLIGLGVCYGLTGGLVLGLDRMERGLAGKLDEWLEGDRKRGGERTSLLSNGDETTTTDQPAPSERARSISFWLHNVFLLLLTYITIFWNVWLSPSHGHCTTTSLFSTPTTPVELFALSPSTTAAPPPPPGSRLGPWFDFWFYPVSNRHVTSGFPPLAWISFCLFGLLYARVVLYKRWSPSSIIAWNLSVSLVLFGLFVATRLLHFGNLSEGCLQMNVGVKNQYLADVKSFFYVTKYPPSPSFFAFTMSVNFALLAGFSATPPSWAARIPGLADFGGSALFFYVAHMYLYFLLSIPARYLFEHDLPDKPPNDWERSKGLGDTAPFWITWVIGLCVLAPMCRAYGRFKARQSTDSLWRFF